MSSCPDMRQHGGGVYLLPARARKRLRGGVERACELVLLLQGLEERAHARGRVVDRL